MKISEKIRQMFCYHMYEDKTLKSSVDKNNICHISNRCCKCGEEFKTTFRLPGGKV